MYYFLRNGKQEGPLSADDLFRAIRRGELPGDVQVSPVDSPSWVPFAALPDSVFTAAVIQEAREINAAKLQPAAKTGCGGSLSFVIVAAIGLVILGTFLPSPEPNFEELAELVLKQGLKDPSSYERTSINTSNRPNGGKEVRIDYRAKNSFGGVIPGFEVLFFDADKNRVDYNGNIIQKFKK